MRRLSASTPQTAPAVPTRADLLTTLRFRLDLWLRARLLPFRVADKDLTDVLTLARPPLTGRYRGFTAETIAAAIMRTTRHPWLMRDRRCLRQGLLGHYFLAAAGYAPELHFAVGRDAGAAGRLTAHCWVEIAGRCVVNRPEEDMATIWVERWPQSAVADDD